MPDSIPRRILRLPVRGCSVYPFQNLLKVSKTLPKIKKVSIYLKVRYEISCYHGIIMNRRFLLWKNMM